MTDRITVSIVEAAKLLGVCRDRIYVLIRSGDLPARKLGNRTLVRRADIEKLVDELPRLELGAAAG